MAKKKSTNLKEVKDDDSVHIPYTIDRSSITHMSDGNFNFGEDKEFKINPVASKFSFDLFDEEKAIPSPIIRIKHTQTSNKNDRWRIYNNNKIVFTLEGTKLLKKEREFLHTVEGVQFLLSKSKSGKLTVSSIKKEIQQCLK